MLAMDQDFVSASELVAHERNSAFEVCAGRGFEVRRRQVQEVNSGCTQCCFVVAILRPQVDHRCDPVLLREFRGAFDREAAADGKLLAEPVEIRLPTAAHGIFFSELAIIIFFFIRPTLVFTADSLGVTAVSTVKDVTTKLYNCSAFV
jgi:hypothetical protein